MRRFVFFSLSRKPISQYAGLFISSVLLVLQIKSLHSLKIYFKHTRKSSIIIFFKYLLKYYLRLNYFIFNKILNAY